MKRRQLAVARRSASCPNVHSVLTPAINTSEIEITDGALMGTGKMVRRVSWRRVRYTRAPGRCSVQSFREASDPSTSSA